MPKSEWIVYEGTYFRIEWGSDAAEKCQARDYYLGLRQAERARALALFKRMADVGRIYDSTKFNQEAEDLYVFKPQPHRFFCFFVKGKRIIIVSAYHKQGQKAPSREIKRARTLRNVWLTREVGNGRRQREGGQEKGR